MIIAFIGSDGSGKTTVAHKVIDELRQRGKDVRYVHNYDNPIHRRRKRSFADKSVIPRPTFARKMWLYMMYVYFLLQRVWDNYQEHIIVRDRYVFDSLVGWTQQGRTMKLSRWLLLNFPLPDKIFLIDALPKTLLARKPKDYASPRQCETKRGMYIGVATLRGIPIIDNNGDLDDTVKMVMEELK